MQIAGAGVVTQAGPMGQHRLDRRPRQRAHIGERSEEAGVIRDHCRHLRLLQHDLRKPDPVRIAGVLPGQVMATGLLLPGD